MKTHKLTYYEREVKRLHAIGKPPDIIAIRLGIKLSKVLSMIAASVV